jgi:hypothetical protein
MPKLGGGGAAPPGAVPQPAMPAPQPASAGTGFFAGLDAKTRYDMVQQLLGSAMSAAQGSNSPILAALAPLAGAVIGGRAGAKFNTARDAENAATADRLGVPEGLDPLMDVLNDPDAPDYLKDIASARIKAAMAPPKARGGRGSGGSGAPGMPRLYNPYTGPDGKRYGTTRDGRVLPYQEPPGGYGATVSEDDPLGIMGADDDDPLELF